MIINIKIAFFKKKHILNQKILISQKPTAFLDNNEIKQLGSTKISILAIMISHWVLLSVKKTRSSLLHGYSCLSRFSKVK